jgi:hypothetical protein
MWFGGRRSRQNLRRSGENCRSHARFNATRLSALIERPGERSALQYPCSRVPAQMRHAPKQLVTPTHDVTAYMVQARPTSTRRARILCLEDLPARKRRAHLDVIEQRHFAVATSGPIEPIEPRWLLG